MRRPAHSPASDRRERGPKADERPAERLGVAGDLDGAARPAAAPAPARPGR